LIFLGTALGIGEPDYRVALGFRGNQLGIAVDFGLPLRENQRERNIFGLFQIRENFHVFQERQLRFERHRRIQH
jgi:hypothetical protein